MTKNTNPLDPPRDYEVNITRNYKITFTGTINDYCTAADYLLDDHFGEHLDSWDAGDATGAILRIANSIWAADDLSQLILDEDDHSIPDLRILITYEDDFFKWNRDVPQPMNLEGRVE